MKPFRDFPTAMLVGLILTIPQIKVMAQTDAAPASPEASMEAKLQQIENNAKGPTPDQTPTVLTEEEVNAYFASGKIDFPVGVKSVSFDSQPEVITGKSRVDFDQLKAGHSSANPLLSVFNGVHTVLVVAHAHAAGGEGYVHVDSVSLDEVDIPRFVLQMFVEKYLHPKYPNVGLDSQFALKDRVDTATVGLHSLSLTQK
jgi:hypothetical protein